MVLGRFGWFLLVPCFSNYGQPDLLRECADLMFRSPALIFNQSIDTGIFPDEWKSARIVPLFKKAGSRSDPSNYRPISIIPVVAKVFERIIFDQLYH